VDMYQFGGQFGGQQYGGQQLYYPYAWRPWAPAIDITAIFPHIMTLILVVMMFTMITRIVGALKLE